MTFDQAVVARHYRTIFESKSDYIARIVDELDRIDPSNVRRPESISLVSGLLTLLHDLDESVAQKYIDDIKERSGNPSLRSSLNILSRFTRSNYRLCYFDKIEIMEERTLDKRYQPTKYVRRWLANLPPQDIEGIRRIYILSSDHPRDYYGNICQFFSVITIVWETLDFHPNLPLHWPQRMQHEHTLYHEIGHHRHQHRERGQVPDQETEADAYAREAMRAAHPVMAAVAKVLGYVFHRKRKRADDDNEPP